MAGQSVGVASDAAVAANPKSRSLAIAASGVRTSREFARLMSALMSDVIEGAVTPATANAAVNAGGKLLKAVELQLRYGRANGEGGDKILDLTAGADPVVEHRDRRKAELMAELRQLETEG